MQYLLTGTEWIEAEHAARGSGYEDFSVVFSAKNDEAAKRKATKEYRLVEKKMLFRLLPINLE